MSNKAKPAKIRRQLPGQATFPDLRLQPPIGKQPGTAERKKCRKPGEPFRAGKTPGKKKGPGRKPGLVGYRTYSKLAYEGIARAIAKIGGNTGDLADGLVKIFREGDNTIKAKILEVFAVLAEKRTPAVLSDEEMEVLREDRGGASGGVQIHLHGMPGVGVGLPGGEQKALPDVIDIVPVISDTDDGTVEVEAEDSTYDGESTYDEEEGQ